MSASKQKRERREARAQGTDKQTLRAQEEKQNAAAKRSVRIKIIAAVAAVAVVLGAAVGVMASDSTYRSAGALQVGDVTLSAAEYNYFYSNVRANYLADYNQYMSMLGITATAAELEKQVYNEETGMTYADKFHEEAQNNIARAYAMAGAAAAEGVTLSAEAQASLDSSIEALDDAAFLENTTQDEYLASVYGRGMDYDTWYSCAETAALADTYMAQKKTSFEFSDAEAIAHYDANESQYKTYDYRSFLFSVKSDAEDQAAAFAEISKQADDFVNRYKNGEDFNDLVLAFVSDDARSYYEENDLTLYEDTIAENISSSYRDWVTDSGRQADEIGLVYDEENGFIYVLNFLGKSDATDAEKAEIARADLQAAAFEEWIAAEQEKYPMTEKGLGMYFADKAL
ncbi:MAG: hypothetical protein IJ452_03480 [Butyricicoccus sp.]|nr:hypothetical protein [Butyricicoccus sp.]